MTIKVSSEKRPLGIPSASVEVADYGAGQVMVFVGAVGAFGITTTVASVRMNQKEAREMAAKLLSAAGSVAVSK